MALQPSQNPPEASELAMSPTPDYVQSPEEIAMIRARLAAIQDPPGQDRESVLAELKAQAKPNADWTKLIGLWYDGLPENENAEKES
jgi:hypothetical protein